jgi:hypothetical protein
MKERRYCNATSAVTLFSIFDVCRHRRCHHLCASLPGSRRPQSEQREGLIFFACDLGFVRRRRRRALGVILTLHAINFMAGHVTSFG